MLNKFNFIQGKALLAPEFIPDPPDPPKPPPIRRIRNVWHDRRRVRRE